MVLELSGSDFVGVCYGRNGNNLPPPSEVIALCRAHTIKKMMTFAADEDVLRALKGSDIELILGIPNSEIQKFEDPSFARIWVQKYVLDYWPDIKFRYIAVGNEVMPHEADTCLVAEFVLPAMENIYGVLSSRGIENQVKVSTVTEIRMLGRTYPPSAGTFLQEVSSFICPILDFLMKINASLLLNVNVHWSYAHTGIYTMSISYPLFTASKPVVKDRQYKYQNLFVAMVDAMHWALDKEKAAKLRIIVCGIGWPSEGIEGGASHKNALTFYSNLIKHVKLGTPRRPRRPIDTYLFSLFDENTESKKHFGLFFPDKRPKYPIV